MTASIIPGGVRVPAELVTDAGVNVEQEDALVVSAARTVDFVGAGVNVANVSGVAVVTISGGGSGLAVDEGGSPVVPVATILNFAGAGVVVTSGGPNTAHIEIDGAGAVVHDSTLTGDGTIALPLGVVATALNGDVAVATDATLTGNGKTATPLHVVGAALSGTVPVATDATLTGNGLTGTPLHVVGSALAGTVPVATDATLTGNGLTGNPLHVVGGTPTGLTIYRPPTPTDGGTVTLHADAVNVVDIQHVSALGLLLKLPAANSVPSGTPLQLALVNGGFYSSLQRGPFTIPPGIFGMNAMIFSVTGADTINGIAIGGVFAAFSKSGDTAQLFSDGTSDWIVTNATWVNVLKAPFALIVSGNGNQISTEADGPVPQQIFCTASADGTELIALSAGYFGQICTITNAGTHAFLIVPDEVAVPRTNNCCYFTGNAQDYRLDPGESLHVQFGQPSGGGVPDLWYVIGHNTLLS